jgi:hypothetical protein
MYIHDGGGGISSDDIDIERQRIDSIMTTLERAQVSVRKGASLAQVPAESLGHAPTATELELHAGKAHSHIVESMDQTVAGLGSYRTALNGFLDDIEARQAEQVQQFTAIETGLSCVAAPTFETNEQCTVPTGADG